MKGNTEIIGMKSSEEEEVKFFEKVIPREYKQNVEKWLLKVEDVMRKSLIKILDSSLSELR